MYKPNKKINIIIVIIILIVALGIYLYTNKGKENIIEYNSDISQNNIENTKADIKEEKIFIHITGAVNNPGVLEMQSSSRIKDAIDMAGGLKENADLSNINLAEIVEDESKIYIPQKGESDEKLQIQQNDTKQENTKNKQNEVKKVQEVQSKENKVIVNINTADKAEFEKLPGIGPAIAEKIVNYRKENGKFSNIEDIKKVSGIGESKFNKIKDFIKIK